MLALAAVVVVDLCGAPPEPAAGPDPADSGAYTEVGDAARATGDLRTAVIAYRKAIALDAENQRAAGALAALCRGATGAADGAKLLAAAARYRAGDREGAAAALVALARGGGDAASGAEFFLGLIALERHDTAAAIRALERARRDPEYRELATGLLRLARRDGTLVAAMLIEPEIDSNPQLVPDTPPSGAMTDPPTPDLDLLAVATFTARPVPWLSVRNAVTWRDQREQSALDFASDDLELAAELATGPNRFALRADGQFALLAGAEYLIAGRAAAGYRRDGEGVSPVASYSLRRRDYQRASEQSFTGWVHDAEAGAIIAVGAGVELDARAVVRRELTGDLAFSHLFGGLRLVARTRSTARVRLTASASAGYARYDGAEPDGALRRDTAIEGAADLEVDLGDHVIAVAGASASLNQSTIEDFTYHQLIARLGLVVAWGGL